jgi:DNA invertase Pin-like site-specific DNA recombinase
MQAAIFTRVSKSTQEYQRQISDLTAIAQKQGWEVVAIIAEKITGVKDNEERDGIEELIKLCESHPIQKVLITEVSRLGRRPSQTHQMLEYLTQKRISIYISQYNIETLLPNGKLNPAASMIFAITADMARQERENLSERIKSGMEEAKRQGKRIGRKEGKLYSESDLRSKYAKPLRDLKQGISIRKVAKIHDLSADTVQRIKKLLPVA